MCKHSKHHFHQEVAKYAEELMAATGNMVGDSKIAEIRSKLSRALQSAKEVVETVEEKVAESMHAADDYVRLASA